MNLFRLFCLTLIVSIAITTQVVAETPAPDPNPENTLVGTWKLVSAKYDGEQSTLPEAATTLKHITPTHYTWLTYDKEGTVTRGAGGTYTLEGDQFTQMGVYGIASTFPLVKGKNTYKCKVDGNKWYHTGKLANGLTIEEVWERIKR